MGFVSKTAADPSRAEQAQGDHAPISDLVVIEAVVKKLKFFNDQTQFFIIDAMPCGPLPGVPVGYEAQAATLQRSLPIKGVSQAFAEGDQVGNTLACHGQWALDPTYGLQFEAMFVQEVVPGNVEGLRKYLGSGKLPGVGPATAALIVDAWGMKTLDVLENSPQDLAKIAGLNEEKAKKIGERWLERKENYEVVAFFGQYGIGEALALKIKKAMGPKELIARVRQNPYAMTEVDGVGFKTADQMAQFLGFALDSRPRLEAALTHVLHERVQQEGHTAVPDADWLAIASQYLGVPSSVLRPIGQELIDRRKVILRQLPSPQNDGYETRIDLGPCVSPYGTALAEHSVAKDLKRLIQGGGRSARSIMSAVHALEDPAIGLDPSQKVAAWTLLSSSVSVMTGGPGTGKTTTLRTVVRLFEEQGKVVVLAAPTGRAAKRMEEAIGVEARTMHRRLGFQAGAFCHNEQNPMDGDVFVLDESSMVDNHMACDWLRAVPEGSIMIFVGDVDQLPSVGAGDVLRNLIDAKVVPVARLTQVHRQAEGSGIAIAAQKVLAGQTPAFDGDPLIEDYAFVRTEDNAESLRALDAVLDGLLSQGFAATDIQVLCPQHNTDLGTDALNDLLRYKLNPTPDAPESSHPRGWRVGDRLMQIKNDYDLNIYNGDMGTIEVLNPDGSLTLTTEDGRSIVYTKGQATNLKLGYAITVHKSQGGERPVIVMPISPSHSFTLNRNLLYTGITRGKKKVVLIGSTKTMVLAASKKEQTRRLTGLVHELHRALAVEVAPAVRPATGFRPTP